MIAILVILTLPLIAAFPARLADLASRNNGGLTVYIKNGTVTGSSLPTFNQEFFGGIRYAAVPKRFEPPKQAVAWNGTYDASNYTSACYGTGTTAFPMSEDCLSLNIIRPENTNQYSMLPVMLWIHGGGFWAGTGSDPANNGSYLVQSSVDAGQPIIFISINYRLLSIGFPTGSEAHAAGAENLGLLDQRMAFKWVQENIASFGGDPGRVTLQGESAGGTSIVQHLVAYGGRDDKLFNAAIIESGSFYNLSCAVDIASTHQKNYAKLLNETGCGDFDCLRTVDIAKLYNVSVKYYNQFLPVIDGDMFKKHPVELWQEGSFIRVPLLMGTNQDEGTILSVLGRNNDTALLSGITSQNTTSYTISASAFPSLLAAYPDNPLYGCPFDTGRGFLSSGTQDKRSNAMFNDAIEESPRRWITGLMASAGQPVYTYLFREVPWKGTLTIGATHAVELSYVFGNPLGTLFDPFGSDAALSKVLRNAWTAFVANHNPNRAGVPYWPDYRSQKSLMSLSGTGSGAQADDHRKDGIQLWTDERIKGCSGLGQS